MSEQGSPEWLAERLGKATASRIADIVARTKSGWGASRANYAAQLVAERLTGIPGESYTNAAMQWGTDHEADARMAYEFYADATVEQVGFIAHPRIAMSGASPDGLIGTDGLLEIKCPMTATMIDILLGASLPDKYEAQMMWQMACTGRAWCDWASFDPRLPATMRLHVRRVHRDDKRIAELETAVVEFLDEVATKVAALEAKYAGGPHPLKARLEASVNILMAG